MDSQPRIRAYDPATDHAFVAKSWVESFAASALGHSFAPDVYQRRWGALVDAVLASPDTCTRVVADDEDPSIILAFSVTEGLYLLHYVFSREDFRGKNYATLLLNEQPYLKIYTSRTIDWQRHPLLGRAIYDPTLLWRHFANARTRTTQGARHGEREHAAHERSDFPEAPARAAVR